MSDAALAVYAVGRITMREWGAQSLGEGAAVVVDDAAVDAQPAGITWLCVREDLDALRQRRPDDACVVVSPKAPAPWRQLSHDVRGPVGVIGGALAELKTDDPLIELAQRATRRLVHMAECWDALAAPIDAAERDAAALLSDVVEDFSSLEPRRAENVRVGEAAVPLRTDTKRLGLGLARLLAHLTRVSREPIELRAPRPDVIELAGVVPPDLSPDVADERSSRLALAIALLAPITEGWEVEGDVLRWRGRRLDAPPVG